MTAKEKIPLFIILKEGSIEKNTIKISGDKYHHLAHVKRVKAHDSVIVSLSDGLLYSGKIKDITDCEIIIAVEEITEVNNTSQRKITLAMSLIKGEKMDLVIQKTTEIGVDEIIPISAGRSVAKWDKKTETNKISRYQKIIEAAAEQSERTTIPAISPLASLAELFAQITDDALVIFMHERNGIGLENAKKSAQNKENIIILIGPEGGWSEDETEFVLNHDNVIPVNLGKNILRAETAAIVSVFAFCSNE